MLDQVNQYVFLVTPKLSSGFLVLLGFWIASIVVEKITLTIGRRAHLHKNIIILLGRVAKTLWLFLGVINTLGAMGMNVSALVASLGLIGFALGFALKDALSNVLARVLVLIYRPFKIGDQIRIS